MIPMGFPCFFFSFLHFIKICCIGLTCFSFSFPYRKEKSTVQVTDVPMLTSVLTEDHCGKFHCVLDS